jgi:hypothetical protein
MSSTRNNDKFWDLGLLIDLNKHKNLKMPANDMAENLWELANIISGFAVIQSIATAFALAKGDFRFSLRTKTEHVIGIASASVFAIFYAGTVAWCWYRATSIDTDSNDQSLWAIVTIGRIGAILLFTVPVIFAFLGHLKNVQKKNGTPRIGN